MYEEFYGLRVKPFQVVPDPAFLYWSEGHSMAFTMLRYGVLNASPLTVITGEVGSGKTTLLRQLLHETPGELVTGLISNIQPGRGELLEWVLMAFDQPFDGSHVERFQRFQQFVIDCYAAGRRVSLIVDEAQNLDVELLEELRMLSNVNADRDQLLQIILVGQPELREMLNWPVLRQFSQRITSDYHLGTLSAEEVYAYIQRRLSVAGTNSEIFPKSVSALIHHATGGVPRLINVLCDLCLVYGFSAERAVIDEELLRELMAGIERNGIYNQFASLSGPPKLLPEMQTAPSRPPASGAGSDPAETRPRQPAPQTSVPRPARPEQQGAAPSRSAAQTGPEDLIGGAARIRAMRQIWSND
jgi:type II secretory pathway predicted ATPase ExeA